MTSLLLALLLMSDFSDHISCIVQGYVYRMTEEEPVSFARADSCQGVRVNVEGQTMVLYSPNYWVSIIIPVESGHRRFQYRWGTGLAHVGAGTVPTIWGYVEKG